jgi:hypothetical protein
MRQMGGPSLTRASAVPSQRGARRNEGDIRGVQATWRSYRHPGGDVRSWMCDAGARSEPGKGVRGTLRLTFQGGGVVPSFCCHEGPDDAGLELATDGGDLAVAC